jgi:hypothetical protein
VSELQIDRNFLHAAHLSLVHPQTGKPLDIHTGLPVELESFLQAIRTDFSINE